MPETFTVLVNKEPVFECDTLEEAVERYYHEIAQNEHIDCAVRGSNQDEFEESYEAYSG